MRDLESLRRLAVDLTSRTGLFVDEEHAGAVLAQHERCAQAGRSGADHGNVNVGHP
jgi:hypothetical protein